MKYISNCEKDTYEIGKKLAENLNPSDVIAFYGDLGAGKTAFTKGVCAHFGIEDVHSPTFTIVNEYNGDVTVYHFDAYRIDDDSWINGGFDEYLFMKGAVNPERFYEDIRQYIAMYSCDEDVVKLGSDSRCHGECFVKSDRKDAVIEEDKEQQDRT